jgi:hypothetical protein
MLEAITGRWRDIGELKLSQIGTLMGTALTLAVLLSIDTLKTASCSTRSPAAATIPTASWWRRVSATSPRPAPAACRARADGRDAGQPGERRPDARLGRG